MEGQQQSDQELIDACLAGSVLAWKTLIERYRALIYSIPIKYGFAEADVDDIFQTTCVRLIEKLPDLRNQERFRGWLTTTVMRICWRTRQQHTKEILTDDFWEAENSAELTGDLITANPSLIELPMAEQWLLDLERRHQLEIAFARLSPRCRQLLGLLFFQEPPASYQEVASLTGITFTSIAPTRSRCLEKLKGLFEAEAGYIRSNKGCVGE
jgi:RNA polymerase sigma factor (sigma-70 family)